MNKLTERLMAEGYTKENHPDYVRWSNWQDFEYTRDYLIRSVWETPCGLLKKGMSHHYDSHMGIDYRPENDNPRLGCPYYDEKPCQYRYDTKLWGWNCVYHQTDKAYDYEQSVEKIWEGWDQIQHEAWLRDMGGDICSCMEWDRPSRSYKPRYDVDQCICNHCKNGICVITKKPRNLEEVNIFYDILRTKHYKKGLFEDTEQTLEKGIKKFKKPVARTDAEIWLKLNQEAFSPKIKNEDCSNLYFSEYHGKTGFGDYDWFEFTIVPQNIRIERRETRDLMQDLHDIQEGIEVVHVSDVEKNVQQAKKDRKVKRAEAKKRKNKKRNAKNYREWIDGDNRSLKIYAEQRLAEDGLNKKCEQMNLFE